MEVGNQQIPNDKRAETAVALPVPDPENNGPFQDSVDVHRRIGILSIALAVPLSILPCREPGDGFKALHQIETVEQEHDPGNADVNKSIALAAMRL